MKRSIAQIVGIILMVACTNAYGINYEVEPNNTTTTAMSIDFGQQIQGNIGSINDLDNFKITAISSSPVRIMFRRTPDDYVYNIATILVRDASGTLVAGSNVYAPATYTFFDFSAIAGKDYYIELAGCQEGSQCSMQRSEIYNLVAINVSKPVYESEDNGSLVTADVITRNAVIIGQHSTMTDLDLFRVYLPSAGNFFVYLSRPSDSYIYTLSNIAILDSFGNLLNSDDVYAPDGYGHVVLSTKAPKTIFLRVTSCNSGSRCEIHYGDQYQIVTNFEPSTKLSVANVSITEGNSGTKSAIFTVKLSQTTTSPVTFNISTTDITTTAGSDYVSLNLTMQSIPAGQISKNFAVTIKGDTGYEIDETFYFNVTNIVGAVASRSRATGTIVDDD